ncbi:hypothetical protein F2P79_008845 [Pimephales promelas]|nr:hypothetical protein F2P79_008845 [Pimephales promelas]
MEYFSMKDTSTRLKGFKHTVYNHLAIDLLKQLSWLHRNQWFRPVFPFLNSDWNNGMSISSKQVTVAGACSGPALWMLNGRINAALELKTDANKQVLGEGF